MLCHSILRRDGGGNERGVVGMGTGKGTCRGGVDGRREEGNLHLWYSVYCVLMIMS